MDVDPKDGTKSEAHVLLMSLVVPRPIAWITSVGDTGIVNLAPFSFFNAIGSDPPCVVVAIGRRDDGTPKDTASNIASGRGFVVKLVTEDLLTAMNVSALDFLLDRSEMTATGPSSGASLRVAAPRLAEAQASLEWSLVETLPPGANTLFVGEVVMFHVADHLIGASLHVEGFAPIGRLGAPSFYCHTSDRFELPRVDASATLPVEGRRMVP